MLETAIISGNVHDSAAFYDAYNKVTWSSNEIETIMADAAHKMTHSCKKAYGDGRALSITYKRPQTMKGGLEGCKTV